MKQLPQADRIPWIIRLSKDVFVITKCAFGIYMVFRRLERKMKKQKKIERRVSQNGSDGHGETSVNLLIKHGQGVTA
ncbi:unnamed protein product [Dovyalis caffra]|uniref:Uncharacterized protein n=1 Tax=Dovyalis caffra TaxID=77055 RepID=A0AAV1S8S9_9ROSI|nr:unnamed protein product [Dovyalis caffra]